VRRVSWLLIVLSGFLQPWGSLGWSPALWIAIVPWALGLELCAAERRARDSLIASAACGVIASAHLWGIGYYSPGVFVACLVYHAAVYGSFGALAYAALRLVPAAAPLVAAAQWAAIEAIRGLGAFTFPFTFGGVLVDQLWVAQLAALLGGPGVAAVLFASSFAAGRALARRLHGGVHRGRGAELMVGALLVGALGFGAQRLARAPRAKESLRVGATQASVTSWMYASATAGGPLRHVVELEYGFLVRDALRRGARVVLLPETAFNWHSARTTQALRKIGAFSSLRLPTGSALAIGMSFVGATQNESLNGVAIAEPDAFGITGPRGAPELREVLVKRRLVPLVEMGHRRGVEWSVGQLGPVRAGFMICFESMFPEAARAAAEAEARLLVVLSDDGGLRRSPLALTHAAQGRLRALEVGLPLVRDGQVGPTYVVDAYGRELGALPHWGHGALVVDVPLHDLRTPYRRAGAWLHWVWLGLGLLPLLVGGLVRRGAA
jgi:apolipoprotein N-acyltransferase